MRTLPRLLIVSIPLFVLPEASRGSDEWMVVDIGAAHGVAAINNRGTVVGSVGIYPFRWDRAQGRQRLPISWGFGTANDINSAGTAVGVEMQRTSTTNTYRVAVWDEVSNRVHPDFGIAFAINEAGHVVGGTDLDTAVYAPYPTKGFIWDGAEFRKLDQFQAANAINNAGQIAGRSSTATTHPDTAILWDPAHGHVFLGTLPGDEMSIARHVNDLGQVVGTSFLGDLDSPDTSRSTAFLWSDGSMTPLRFPGFEATTAAAINGSGQVVGYAFDPGVAGSVAVLWQDGQAIDLNDFVDPTSGWVLTRAADINDRMEIVGQGTLDGRGHAFLLTQSPPLPSLGLRADGGEVVLEWTEGAIPVVLQFSPTLGRAANWADLLDTSDGSPGESLELRRPMDEPAGFFRFHPLFAGPSRIASR
jgi:probable HAF family extracellular repeat protein